MAENMKKREARIQKAGGVIGGVIGIASIVFAMAVVVFSGVSVKLTGTALELSGGIGDRASIPYTEITGVEWRDVFDKGSRTWGTGTGKISSGTFTNDEFGAYRLYLHNRVRCAVVVCALPGFVDSKNEEKTERNAGYLVVSHSGGGMLRQGTRKGIRRTPANRGMRAHWVVKGLDISEDVCHGMCP